MTLGVRKRKCNLRNNIDPFLMVNGLQICQHRDEKKPVGFLEKSQGALIKWRFWVVLYHWISLKVKFIQ